MGSSFLADAYRSTHEKPTELVAKELGRPLVRTRPDIDGLALLLAQQLRRLRNALVLLD